MSRIPLPFAVGDVSALARSLRSQMEALDRIPTHLELLNMLARAGGRRNFQHLRAAPLNAVAGLDHAATLERPEAPAAPPAERAPRPVDAPASAAPVQQAAPLAGATSVAQTAPDSSDPARQRRLKRLAGYFDAQCRLIRWPGKHSHREPCLWALWTRIPAGEDLDEPRVNALLQEAHLFGDHALLRRELFDHGLLTRTPDGRVYRRVERRPADEALELLRSLGQRRATG